jgi:hypothetical protein
MAKKSCKKGYYYCYASKKCKRIPMGYVVGMGGWLRREKEEEKSSDDTEGTKKNGNGNSSNGNGNGNGGSNGGSNGGGVSEAWSAKYKKSIDCDNPKGFSQRAHCRGRKMNEEKKKDHEYSMARSELKTIKNAASRLQKKMGKTGEGELKAWVQSKITKAADYIDTAADYVTNEETCPICGHDPCQCLEGVITEKRDGKSSKDKGYSLRDWFKGGGWKQTGGKYDGKPCAKQPGQKTKPYCRDADDRAAMSKEERNKRARKKRKEDPNPNRTGRAKNVTQESYSNWRKDFKQLDEIAPAIAIGGALGLAAGGAALIPHVKKAGEKLRNQADKRMGKSPTYPKLKEGYRDDGDVIRPGDKILRKNKKVLSDDDIKRMKDKGIPLDKAHYEPQGELVDEGKKDACYHKVKSRYSVWPSAYASGALVKCRKVGAKNWGNKTKKEDFSDWREDMLLEGLEDKLRKMSPEQIEDLIKANKGAEKKIRDAIKNLRTPKSQGPGAQLPNVPKQPASTSSATPRETYQRGGSDRVSYQRARTVTRADVQGGTEAAKRAASGQGRYKPGVGVTSDFKLDPKFKPPGSRGMGGKVRPRGRGRLGLAVGAATLAAPFVVGAIKKAFNKEDYDYSNWRDDFKATEYESVDIIETEPLRPTKGIGSDMLGEAKKCWKGYKKTGTQKLFGKTYNRCEKIKKEEVEIQEAIPGYDKYDAAMKAIRKKKLSGRALIDALKYAGGLRPKTEKEVNQKLGEDWQKSNRKDGVDGMSQKSVNAYKRENPGSKLQTAVTGKNPKGKDKKRRKSFCARSNGQRKMHNIDCSKTPDKKICKARKRWRC